MVTGRTRPVGVTRIDGKHITATPACIPTGGGTHPSPDRESTY